MAGGGGSAKETSYDKALASIGAERQERYKEVFVPIQKYIADKTLNSQPEYQNEAQGVSNANYQQQFGIAQPDVVAGEGARQTGGAFAPKLGGFATNRGLATGLGAVDTNLGSQRNFTQNLQGLIDIGSGQSGAALNSLNSAANASQQQAILDARASSAASNAIRQGIGVAGGVGAGLYKTGYFNQNTPAEVLPTPQSGIISSQSTTPGGGLITDYANGGRTSYFGP